MLPLILHQHKTVSQSFFLIMLHSGRKPESKIFSSEEFQFRIFSSLHSSVWSGGIYIHMEVTKLTVNAGIF